MVKEEIVAGLKYAIAKGENLPNAMMSFYNAGYSKQDIEEAARVLQASPLPRTQPTLPIQQPGQQPIQQNTLQPTQQSPAPMVTQRVSAYGGKPKSRGKALIFVLVLFLVILFGILIAVFLFRDQLADFLGNIL
ncbi:MAG TPA: hypothetical protein VMV95_01155 [Bacillota bacterium]|nr:hypothetical protein [Bacillota bacterium]